MAVTLWEDLQFGQRYKNGTTLKGCQMVHIVSYQKSQYVYILEGLGMEDVGIF
jgi:hypothetical protein